MPLVGSWKERRAGEVSEPTRTYVERGDTITWASVELAVVEIDKSFTNGFEVTHGEEKRLTTVARKSEMNDNGEASNSNGRNESKTETRSLFSAESVGLTEDKRLEYASVSKRFHDDLMDFK